MLLAASTELAVFDVLIRALHIGAALILGGAAAYQWIALVPSLATVDEARRIEFREMLAARWRIIAWTAMAILLLTGLLNFIVNKIPEYRSHPQKGIYHALFGVKFLLALAAFHAGTVLTLPGPKGEKYRAHAKFWLTLLLLFIAAIVVIAAILRDFPILFPAPAAH